MLFNDKAVTIIDSKEKRVNFFQNLLLMAVSDRDLDVDEEEFLVEIGNQLDLSPEDVVSLAEKPVDQMAFIVPDSEADKLFELQTLVMMMVQDGEIHERELNLCRQYAEKVGLNQTILDDMVQKLSA